MSDHTHESAKRAGETAAQAGKPLAPQGHDEPHHIFVAREQAWKGNKK